MSDETTSAAHGSTIRLTLYSEAGAVATVALDLVRAVALARPHGVRSGSRWSPAPQRSQLIDSTLATHAVRDFYRGKRRAMGRSLAPQPRRIRGMSVYCGRSGADPTTVEATG